MGKTQRADAVAKDMSTSIYGNTVAITESPLEEGLLYVGTDDGLVHVTPDGGKTWSKIDAFPGVPHMSYVSYLLASRHEKDRVYAAFDNHKNGDFKPYLLVSDDRGGSWRSISGDLSDRDICYAIAEDHVEPWLLFVGTEFGASFTVDGGKKWQRVRGLPTIAVRDLEIQTRENDLVMGTFGRSFYVLDDYSPLRTLAEVTAEKKEGHVFPVKKALLYVERSRLGGRGGRGSQGGAYYNADNPPFGAVFTYLLSDKLSTRLEKRKEREKKDDAPYPTVEEMRAEDEEKEPRVFLTVRKGTGGEVVRHVEGSRQKGLHRVAWDLRYPGVTPVQVSGRSSDGPLVVPGTYSVTLSKEVDGVVSEIAPPVPFEVKALDQSSFPAQDPAEVLAFHHRAGELLRAVTGAQRALGEAQERLSHLRLAVTETPAARVELLVTVEEIQKKIHGLGTRLSGDRTVARRQEPTSPSIAERIRSVWSDAISVTSAPTRTQQDQALYAAEEFSVVLKEVRSLIEKDLADLEKALEAAGAPWTPGRVPIWGDN
jgi:hypothetical protein